MRATPQRNEEQSIMMDPQACDHERFAEMARNVKFLIRNLQNLAYFPYHAVLYQFFITNSGSISGTSALNYRIFRPFSAYCKISGHSNGRRPKISMIPSRTPRAPTSPHPWQPNCKHPLASWGSSEAKLDVARVDHPKGSAKSASLRKPNQNRSRDSNRRGGLPMLGYTRQQKGIWGSRLRSDHPGIALLAGLMLLSPTIIAGLPRTGSADPAPAPSGYRRARYRPSTSDIHGRSRGQREGYGGRGHQEPVSRTIYTGETIPECMFSISTGSEATA